MGGGEDGMERSGEMVQRSRRSSRKRVVCSGMFGGGLKC